MWEPYHRSVATLGDIINTKALYVQTYEQGVSFSTMFYKGM